MVRFSVRSRVWLSREKCVPIHELKVWKSLSFTREFDFKSHGWTGMLRRSLNQLNDEDGAFLANLMEEQARDGETFPLDERKYRRLTTRQIRRHDKMVLVTVPTEEDAEAETADQAPAIRESASIQALLAKTGEAMGFSIWIPRNDRSTVLREWSPAEGRLLETLPLNYDEVTLDTIEQIDVLWLKRRAIVRAFEVEHTTAVNSGILRMADLLALQPNMDIRLHIVAPEERKEKVFSEIRRPVFSLLDRAPLAECCTFLSYDSLRELASEKHLSYLPDAIIEKFEERAD